MTRARTRTDYIRKFRERGRGRDDDQEESARCCSIIQAKQVLSELGRIGHGRRPEMSGRRDRISDDEINELISKLQALLPESSRRRNASRVR